jgi:uncharacterized Zn finger protein
MAQKGKIEIFLYERLIEDAIAIAPTPTYHSASRDLIYRIMDAAISVNPDWVIENACPPAEKILNAKKSEYYDEAIAEGNLLYFIGYIVFGAYPMTILAI